MSEQNKLQAQELATLLDVTPASLSGAAKKDHLCQGYPVAEWAEKTSRGRVTGYIVPDEVLSKYEKKYDRETERAKNWVKMWNDRLTRMADADEKKNVEWMVDAMEETNRMMNVELEFPDLWQKFVSIRDKRFRG